MINGVLLDLSGVVYIGDHLIEGALKAIQTLQTNHIPIRYITNTTRSTSSDITSKLTSMNLDIAEDQLFTASLAAKNYTKENNLKPYLLIHPNLLSDFSEFDAENYDSVLLGDAGSNFTYESLNKAFRILLKGKPLIAMGKNRYFKEIDGFSLDAGPFVHALEIASGINAVVIGKPAKEFFLQAIKDFNCSPKQVVMIGDDVDADVIGAMSAGLQSILVQTGKYRASDNMKIQNSSARIASNISSAVDIILNEH